MAEHHLTAQSNSSRKTKNEKSIKYRNGFTSTVTYEKLSDKRSISDTGTCIPNMRTEAHFSDSTAALCWAKALRTLRNTQATASNRRSMQQFLQNTSPANTAHAVMAPSQRFTQTDLASCSRLLRTSNHHQASSTAAVQPQHRNDQVSTINKAS